MERVWRTLGHPPTARLVIHFSVAVCLVRQIHARPLKLRSSHTCIIIDIDTEVRPTLIRVVLLLIVIYMYKFIYMYMYHICIVMPL